MYMTQGQGQWPWVTGKNGFRKITILLKRSVELVEAECDCTEGGLLVKFSVWRWFPFHWCVCFRSEDMMFLSSPKWCKSGDFWFEILPTIRWYSRVILGLSVLVSVIVDNPICLFFNWRARWLQYSCEICRKSDIFFSSEEQWLSSILVPGIILTLVMVSRVIFWPRSTKPCHIFLIGHS